MSDRITIASLRERALPGRKPHRLTMNASVVTALVEAVEAARVVVEDFYACGGDVSATGEEAIDALALLLARFDFEAE